MSHCRTCGAPSYHSPCAACNSRNRNKVTEPSEIPLSVNPDTVTLNDSAKWRSFKNLANRLYKKAQAYPTFDPSDWSQLEEVVADIALAGIGLRPAATNLAGTPVNSPGPVVSQPEPPAPVALASEPPEPVAGGAGAVAVAPDPMAARIVRRPVLPPVVRLDEGLDEGLVPDLDEG